MSAINMISSVEVVLHEGLSGTPPTRGPPVRSIHRVELLERDSVIGRMDALFSDAAGSAGRVVVIRGEAGVGKTSVLRAFCDQHGEDAHVLWGGCDDLLTPQPLGPIWDMTLEEPAIEEWLLEGKRPELFRGVRDLLARSLRPTVMVIEDVHWADESTTDLIRYLGRRIDRTHGLLIVTVRDDVVDGDDPVQALLGHLPAHLVEQIPLQGFTQATVSRLAGDVWDADELWRLTRGNPFFVSELLEAGPESLPVSVRNAVMSKVLELSRHGRELVDLASVVPGGVGLSVVHEILADRGSAIEECERQGILHLNGDQLMFRHELARQAVADALPKIRRRELNTRLLEIFEAHTEDVAICAHFAREAGGIAAMLRLLPEAAQRAASTGSHREALSHLRALRPNLDRMDTSQRADHYDLWAREEYFAGGDDAEDLVSEAISLRKRLGDRIALGRTLLAGSEIFWWRGKRELAMKLAHEAVSALEPIGGEDLAMAYATLSRWSMVGSDTAGTFHYAERALAQLGDEPSRVRVHVLNSRGVEIAVDRYPEGFEDLEASYQMAEELGLQSDQARAAHNIGSIAFRRGDDLRKGRDWLARSVELSEEAQTPALAFEGLAELAWIDEMSGDWDRAEQATRSMLEGRVAGVDLPLAAAVLARVLMRRGHRDAADAAADAWASARQSDEPQRLGPAGAALIEFVWLGNHIEERLIEEVVSSYRRHSERRGVTSKGISYDWRALVFWLSAIGEIARVPEEWEPYVLLDRGEWKRAAAYWDERGVPYEKALSLSFGDTTAKLEALAILDRLGAIPLAKRVRDQLRTAGVEHVPSGPHRATQKSPLGLTPKQTEVLDLLVEGLTNHEIAERLFVSTRTVETHVSAILSKLGASDRTDAVARASAAEVD